MNLRNALSVLSAVIPAGLLLSCQNSAGPMLPGSPEEVKAAILAYSWTPVARTVSPGIDVRGDGVLVTDLHASEDTCEHDDQLRFRAEGTWDMLEGLFKCREDHPAVATGVWSLNAAADSLTRVDSSAPLDTIKSEILVLTATRLSISTTRGDWPDGKTRNEVFTWKAGPLAY